VVASVSGWLLGPSSPFGTVSLLVPLLVFAALGLLTIAAVVFSSRD
jgi:hypothetical protein